MDYYELTYTEALIFILLCLFIFLLIAALFFKKMFQYINERESIKAEMQSSFSRREYLYWKRKLKRLYLKYLPFIGRFFK